MLKTWIMAENMESAEGVIKYTLHHEPLKFQEEWIGSVVQPSEWFLSFMGARKVFYDLGLIGQTKDLYDGYGYGNMSHKLPSKSRNRTPAFLVTGTQTSGFERPRLEDFALVHEWDIKTNTLYSKGEVKPSSEALSHAILYESNEQIQCVLHGHSKMIWEKSLPLKLETTSPDAEYGTVQMAEQVGAFGQKKSSGVISMLGHEDGILAWGTTVLEAVNLMVEVYARAAALDYFAGQGDGANRV